MTEHKTIFAQRLEKPVGRRRIAPKAQESSDINRFRGLWQATLLGGLGAAATLFWFVQQGTSLAPQKSLSRPHRLANLQCSNCHDPQRAPDAELAVSACISCHGPHPSVRAPHQELFQSGQLHCATCHQIHEADGGVSFLSDGTIIRYDGEHEQIVQNVDTHFFATQATTVPVPEASACSTCHDLNAPRDFARYCLFDNLQKLGDEQPIACFDEHRSLFATVGTERTAAWAATRAVVQTYPTVSATNPANSSILQAIFPWLLMGMGTALGSYGLYRSVFAGLTRRRRKAPTTVHDAPILPATIQRLPQINTATCIGCNACVDACPYDVLEMRNYIARVVRPDDCCGLTLCEQRCPNGSLIITDGQPIDDRPRMNETYESLDTPGIYLAGDLTGLPLIRNAINQGAQVVKTVTKNLLKSPVQTDVDVVIVGAGPAGISAALEAKKQKLRYRVFEQASAAESIRSFPRGKLVFDQPLGMPLVGDLWLKESTKEELVGKWMRIIYQENLIIREQQRVTTVEKVRTDSANDFFTVRAVDPQGNEQRCTTQKVILAFGRRGSPRKLAIEIPESMIDHVHYSLADARSFAGTKVLVIGLGDVAMEAAIALSKQPGTTVHLSYRGSNFRRGKSRNVEEVKRLMQAKRIHMHFGSDILRIEAGKVHLASEQGSNVLECEAIFVMIGTIPPWSFLESLGVRRVDKAPEANSST